MTTESSRTFTDTLIIEISHLLSPLKRIDSADRVFGLMRDLGWELPATDLFTNGFSIVSDIETLMNNIYQIGHASTSEDYLDLLDTVKNSIESTIEIITKEDGLRAEIKGELSAYQDFVTNSGIASEKLPERLLDYLLILYLQTRQPKIYSILNLLGLIEIKEETATQTYEPSPIYALRVVHWDRFVTLFTDPLEIAEEVYQWQSDFNTDLFLSRFELVLRSFLIPGGLYQQDTKVHDEINLGSDENRELRIPLYQSGQWPETYMEAGLNVAPLSADPSAKNNKGFAIIPYLLRLTEITENLSPQWQVKLSGSLNLNDGIGLLIRPPHELALKTDLFTKPQESFNARLEASITRIREDDKLFLIFGSQDASRLGIGGFGFRIIVEKTEQAQELSIEFELNQLTLVINTSNSDGFLQTILSGINIETVCDIAIGWSNLDGVYFRGSGALEITIPIHKSLGPINIQTAYITIGIGGDISVTLAVSLSAVIGPVAASVERIGLRIPISFPSDKDGNLGPVQVETPQFKPPTGAGLAVDAGGIVGGGFLEFDNANKRYAGVLGLNFGEIGLTAIGLITTKMPDGKSGFAMLINIGVTFDPPIQLSFGFTLSGVGGLVGVNRSMEVDVLRTGIKNRTLDSILFPDPETVIANASKIISDLRSVFPPAEGRFVVGPMVKIGWGSPNIITAEIGIFLELPDPVRIVLMGQLEAVLPQKKDEIVVIHLDVLGVLDIAKEELTFQASLYDSRVLTFPMFGDSAFIYNWGKEPRFALSLGGFHPKFTPPPPSIVFADLKRLTICISSGSNLQLFCKAYQALTPNTLQFGARVDLYASIGGATVKGYLSFDTLFYFSPFAFEVWMSAGVQIKYKGVSLSEVDLSFLLSGPTPWLVRGKAKIKILFTTVKIRFCITWGLSEKATLPAVDPWKELKEALADPGNWGTVLPAGRTLVESLRAAEGTASTQIVVHPSGRFEVRQNIVPLGIDLDKVANTPITGHDRFDIEDLTVSGESLEPEPIEEFFARGQFEELSADQKLSLPSFEKMKGGVTTAALESVCMHGSVDTKPLAYESILIKPDRTSQRQQPKGGLEWEDAKFIAQASIGKRAIYRAGPKKRFASLRPQPKRGVSEERYCIACVEDLARVTLSSQIEQDNRNLSRMAADQLLKAQLELEPEQMDILIVIPEYEVFEVAA